MGNLFLTILLVFNNCSLAYEIEMLKFVDKDTDLVLITKVINGKYHKYGLINF